MAERRRERSIDVKTKEKKEMEHCSEIYRETVGTVTEKLNNREGQSDTVHI